MIEDGTQAMTTITPKPPTPNPKDLLKLVEGDYEMKEPYEMIIERYVQDKDNAICDLWPESISKLLNL